MVLHSIRLQEPLGTEHDAHDLGLAASPDSGTTSWIAWPDRGPAVTVFTNRDEMRLEQVARAARTNRFPHWSSSFNAATAVVAGWTGRIGVHLERSLAPDEFSEVDLGRLVEAVATPAERSLLASLSVSTRARTLTDWWSAKEAFAKASSGDDSDYDPASLESPALWSGGRNGTWRCAALDPAHLRPEAFHAGRAPTAISLLGWTVWEDPSR